MERQLRMTPQREAVLEVVRETHDHPTAGQIYERVRHRTPRFSCTTVYNALAALAKQGEVLALSFGDGASRYDGRNDGHDHALCLGLWTAGGHRKPLGGGIDRRSGGTERLPHHRAPH